MGRHGASHWDSNWEAAITPNGEDSLYGSGDGYQAVNDWSGVYEVPSQTGFYEQGAVYDYETPAVAAPVMDQSYYESVYAAYSPPPQQAQAQAQVQAPPVQPYQQQHPQQPVIPAQPPAAESSPMWDGQAWQDPYAQQVQHAPQPQHPQPQYEQQDYNFHHPDFDTGTFEAIYEAPGSTEASYDLLPDGEGAYDDEYEAYDQGYADDGYDDAEDYEGYGYEAYDDADDPDGLEDSDGGHGGSPLRSRSRSGGTAPARPFGSKAARPSMPVSGRRTLHAFTSTPAAVVGVAAVAVAAVGGLRLPASHTENTADAAAPATPTNGLEQNLLEMRTASANLADRATRSEQRSELVQQQALEKQRLAEMAQKYYLPVQDYILTAGFGQSGDRWMNLHTGQDFAVPTGTKVVAITDGTVIESGWAGAYGYRIVIQHPDGSQTWYCHLSVMKVRSGKVSAGQIIALSGDTGNSTGPHMHFEYHPPGPADPANGVPGASTAVNPMPFLRSHGLVP
jgi:murein DD-endopeptidase MepM/ murein hydrolase activator NlpD